MRKVACILPNSISKFRIENQPDYNIVMQFPSLIERLKEVSAVVQTFDFLSSIKPEAVLDSLRNYAADVWIIGVHFCMCDLRLFLDYILKSKVNSPFIICYGIGVIDWHTCLHELPVINIVIPMTSVGTVVDCVRELFSNGDFKTTSGAAFRKDIGMKFTPRKTDDFCRMMSR